MFSSKGLTNSRSWVIWVVFVFCFLSARLWKMIPSLGELFTIDMSSRILPPHVSQGRPGWDLRRGGDVNESSRADPEIHKHGHRRQWVRGSADRLEQSLGFGSYKDTRNREAIDLGEFIHKTQRKKENQMADNGTLVHGSILGESKRTNKGNWEEQPDEGRELREDTVPEAKETAWSRKRQWAGSWLWRVKILMDAWSMSIGCCRHWGHLWL